MFRRRKKINVWTDSLLLEIKRLRRRERSRLQLLATKFSNHDFKGEEFIFRSNLLCAGSILNVKTRYAGHSTGASYQLTKKTRIRHSQHRGSRLGMKSGIGLDLGK